MYNLRYHITSLVSVFLALALGLVLGGLIVQRGTFDRQREALVEGLQAEFADVRAEMRTLTAENARLEAFSQEFVAEATAQRLEGKTVVVVTNAGREDGMAAAREAIEGAGGEVAVVTLVSPDFGLEDPELGSSIASLAPDAADPQASIATSLAAEWAAPGEARPLTMALVEQGVLRVEDLPDDVAVAGVVDISAPDGQADPAGLAIVEQAAEAGLVGVGAQTPTTDSGVAADAAGRGLAGMDTLGTTIGRYTLVSILAGAEPALYGIADAADALFPPFER
jgi:hypothetical protein